MEADGKVVRQHIIPLEINSVWSWVKSFNCEWEKYFPAISSIEVQKNKTTADKDGDLNVVRTVTVEKEGVTHVFKERLDFCEQTVFTILYTLLDYHCEAQDSNSQPQKIHLTGTVFSISLKSRTNDVDNSPETVFAWTCTYNPDVLKLRNLAKTVFTIAIDSCFDEFERRFNEPIGTCKVFLRGATGLITADVFSSDPYCALRMSDMPLEEARKSRVKKWTKNPDFNEDFELPVRPKSLKLIIALWDYDSVGGDDDPMGSTEMEFSDLQDGVAKEMTLDLNTQGRVKFKICIEMENNKAIPVSPLLRKQKLDAEKAKKSGNVPDKSAQSEAESCEVIDSLAQFVQAKLLEDSQAMFSKHQCRVVANSYLYLSVYQVEIAQNMPQNGASKMDSSNKNAVATSLKALLEQK